MKIGSLMDAVAEEQMGLRCMADGRARLYSHDKDGRQTRTHVSAGRGLSFLIEAQFGIALTARIICLHLEVEWVFHSAGSPRICMRPKLK